MDYLSSLNNEQKRAATEKNGPVLVIAGAGAGKTKTLTHRILHLIKEGVAPQSILAITFTNKAAKEMRDRVEKLLAASFQLSEETGAETSTHSHPNSYQLKAKSYPWLGTFHALGVHILKENARLLGIPRHFSIIDKGDSLKFIKEAMDTEGVDRKNFDPSLIANLISREKAGAVTCAEFGAKVGHEYIPEIVARVWKRYEEALAREKSLDFDDLLLKTALLLKENQSVREHYQNVWSHIHIDEYQDTNRVQYLIAKYLAEQKRNICVVGDVDQCLPPDTKIKTVKGEKKIKDIKKGDVILGASGNGGTCEALVSEVKEKKYEGGILEIKTENGHSVNMTPEHILFARLAMAENEFYVYLMYRRDKGFRIGQAKSVRRNSAGESALGLLVRCNQEKADKMWVLKMCKTRSEATYWEIFFSSSYGIPSLVFLTGGRKMAIKQGAIDKIFMEIDTRNRAEKLFNETGMSFDYPHYFPQGTTRTNTERERLNIKLSMFGDRRKSLVHPWGMSRVSINTTDPVLKRNLEKSGFTTRKGKRKDWRLEMARLDYSEAENIANKIRDLKPDLTIVKNAFVTTGKKMLFQPASNIISGMVVVGMKDGRVVEEKVVSVVRKQYTGNVYDLNVKNIHNYIANGVVVHNCIYGWRGADIKNIMGFEKDYPEAKIIFLDQNYRSTKNILTAANRVIAKNKMRPEKNLFTKNGEGEKIGLFEAYDENDEARFVARKSKELIEGKGVSPSEIAVLYRANFQGRALEEGMLNNNVPYQVLGTRFFERKEVKDIIAYLKAARNPEGLADLKRIINEPPRGLGKVTVLKVFAGQEAMLPPATRKKVADFKRVLAEISAVALKEKPSQTVKYILRASGMEAELKKGGADDEERLENIRELVTFATKYDIYAAPEEGIEKFLEDAALASDQDELMKNREAVKLMTVHAAKGLEFEYVFITGLEDDLFPHKKMNGDKFDERQSEEERRLFYVALTRAKKKLYLSYASVRTIFGSRQINVPSEFVFDVDEELVEKEEKFEGGGKIIYLD